MRVRKRLGILFLIIDSCCFLFAITSMFPIGSVLHVEHSTSRPSTNCIGVACAAAWCAADHAAKAVAVRIPFHGSSSLIVKYLCAENVLNMVPTVWWTRSVITFTWGFLLVMGFFFAPFPLMSFLRILPYILSPGLKPLLGAGHGCRVISQVCSMLFAATSAVFVPGAFWISNQPVAQLIIVIHHNSSGVFCLEAVLQGPIISTQLFCHGVDSDSFSGNPPSLFLSAFG
jgi:hypothetical protein